MNEIHNKLKNIQDSYNDLLNENKNLKIKIHEKSNEIYDIQNSKVYICIYFFLKKKKKKKKKNFFFKKKKKKKKKDNIVYIIYYINITLEENILIFILFLFLFNYLFIYILFIFF